MKKTYLSTKSGVLKNHRAKTNASYLTSSRTPQTFVSSHPPAENTGVESSSSFSRKISLKTPNSILGNDHPFQNVFLSSSLTTAELSPSPSNAATRSFLGSMKCTYDNLCALFNSRQRYDQVST